MFVAIRVLGDNAITFASEFVSIENSHTKYYEKNSKHTTIIPN
jgi:peptide methionine sulfoxide reductase MsrA